MTAKTNEHTINDGLGEILKELGPGWNVDSEKNDILEGGGRMDILIEKPGGWPVVIEAEVNDKQSAYNSAKKKQRIALEEKLKTTQPRFILL